MALPSITHVVLDVFSDLIAIGLLVLPDGIDEVERRPVVVCQHGLEGTPDELLACTEKEATYAGMAMRLAQRGFITFAPQKRLLYEARLRLEGHAAIEWVVGPHAINGQGRFLHHYLGWPEPRAWHPCPLKTRGRRRCQTVSSIARKRSKR